MGKLSLLNPLKLLGKIGQEAVEVGAEVAYFEEEAKELAWAYHNRLLLLQSVLVGSVFVILIKGWLMDRQLRVGLASYMKILSEQTEKLGNVGGQAAAAGANMQGAMAMGALMRDQIEQKFVLGNLCIAYVAVQFATILTGTKIKS